METNIANRMYSEELMELISIQEEVIAAQSMLNNSQGEEIVALHKLHNCSVDLEQAKQKVREELNKLARFNMQMREKYADENQPWSQKEINQEDGA